MSELKNLIESLLFSAGKRLTIEDLSRLTKEENQDAIKAALIILQKELEDKHSSLMLVQEGDAYKLTVREKYISVVKKVVTTPELPKSIMETLAVVAYKAPVLQSQVIKIRTNKAYRHLDEIEEIGYITREKKGRSKLIKLTPKFFDYFDVPPEKLKDKFKNVAALEKAIEEKESAAQDTQAAIIEAAKEPQIVPITKELPKFAPEIEVVGDKVGELETYGEREEKKKKKHKKKKEKEEEGVEPSEAAEELAAKILAGEEKTEEAEEKPKKKKKKAKEEAEEAPAEEEIAEEVEEIKEKGLTIEQIKEEAARTKPKKSTYAAKGLYAEGVPEEIKERIEHRVAEIVGEPPQLPEEAPAEEEKPEEVAEEAPAEEEKPAEEPKEEAPAEEAPEEEKPAEEAPEEPAPEEKPKKKRKKKAKKTEEAETPPEEPAEEKPAEEA